MNKQTCIVLLTLITACFVLTCRYMRYLIVTQPLQVQKEIVTACRYSQEHTSECVIRVSKALKGAKE